MQNKGTQKHANYSISCQIHLVVNYSIGGKNLLSGHVFDLMKIPLNESVNLVHEIIPLTRNSSKKTTQKVAKIHLVTMFVDLKMPQNTLKSASRIFWIFQG